jgi:RimK-like ATP-grasp domain
MTKWIFKGNRPSNGASFLAAMTGFKRWRTGAQTEPRYRVGDVIINWGYAGSEYPHLQPMWNLPDRVRVARNKLAAFQTLGDQCPTVEWTTNSYDVQSWLYLGHQVIGRQTLTGHSGEGIIIIEPHELIPDCPLYTKYQKSTAEFRVHVFRDNAFDIQRKIRDPGRVPTNWHVRSHDNGFIFVRNGLSYTDGLKTVAINAIKVLGLDFGAVDILKLKNGDYKVLEVNTAPGLTGQTLTNYYNAFTAND